MVTSTWFFEMHVQLHLSRIPISHQNANDHSQPPITIMGKAEAVLNLRKESYRNETKPIQTIDKKKRVKSHSLQYMKVNLDDVIPEILTYFANRHEKHHYYISPLIMLTLTR